MASVHPSRAGLVPKDSPAYADRHRPRSPSPRRRRSPSPRRRTPSPRRSRSRERTNRASPEYDDYKRPLPPQELQVPWHQDGSGTRDRPPHYAGNAYGGGGGDMMDSRRAKRDATVVDIWPPSPKAAARDLSPKRGKSSKKSKRPRSVSSDSSEEEYRRRKERKEKKRAKKDRERRSSRKHRDSESDSDDIDRSGRPSRTKALPPSRTPSPLVDEEDDEWIVKPVATPSGALPLPNDGGLPSNSSVDQVGDHDGDDGDSDDDLGPQPLHKPSTSKRIDERSYGGSLLRGEGSAMAAFLQDGTESRIPRRGEIGLTSDEIAKYEDVGYVMSGSRHRRMNAVRMRKENQVISAEEKRGILKLQKEERERREAILREEFSELVNDRLKGTENRNKN